MAMKKKWTNRNLFWQFIKLCLLQVGRTGSIQILSRGRTVMVNSGQSVTLECQVYAEPDSFHLFRNPVVWNKTQNLEECRITMMGSTQEPFNSEVRFNPSYAPHNPSTLKHFFELSIYNVSVEDSGNYTCHVLGPLNVVLVSVTYYVMVRVHPQQIIVTTENAIHLPHPHLPKSEEELHLSENKLATVRCISVGGYPPVNMDILIGRRNLTNQFSITHTSHVVGSPCKRVVVQVVERWSHQVQVSSEDDGRQLRCVVSINGLQPHSASARLVVQFSPVIDCLPVTASVGDIDLHLTCKVKARPEVTSLYWVIKGVTVSKGQNYNEYITSVRDSSDGMLYARLQIKHVRTNNFHTYRVIAENIIGVSHKDVILQKRPVLAMFTTRENYLVGMDLQNGSSGEISVLSRTIHSHDQRSIYETLFYNSALAISQKSSVRTIVILILMMLNLETTQQLLLPV